MSPLPLSSAGGQSLEDKIQAMKYFISGQGLSFVVLKATTSELMGPKKKHLNYLAAVTDEPNVSIPKLVKYLMRRARCMQWSISFKALITIHHLMDFGNEKFIQNLASSSAHHRTFEYLSSFADRSNHLACDMSTFVRRYSRYINSKIQTYRALGTDFCKIKTNGLISSQSPGIKKRAMRQDQLLMLLQTLQSQFDMLVAFDATPKDLNNGIINSAFSMLYKDFVKLYITYQSSIIRLLELYYSINQVRRLQELLGAYKKFLVRMDKVTDFMRVINVVGMDKSDLPDDITKLPSFNLKQLEARLSSFEQIYASSRIHGHDRKLPVELPKPNCELGSIGRRRSLRRGISLANAETAAAASSSKRRVDDLSDVREETMNRLDFGQTDYECIEPDNLNQARCPKPEIEFGGNKDEVPDLLIDINLDEQHPSANSKLQPTPTASSKANNCSGMESSRQMPDDWVRVEH